MPRLTAEERKIIEAKIKLNALMTLADRYPEEYKSALKESRSLESARLGLDWVELSDLRWK